MPDGFSYSFAPGDMPPAPLRARRGSKIYVAAACVAVVFHCAVLVAVLWLTTHLVPPASVASVEITPIPEATPGLAQATENPAEATSPASLPDAAAMPSPPETATTAARPEQATAPPSPPDMAAPKTPPPPETATRPVPSDTAPPPPPDAVANAAPPDSATPPPPEAVDMLSSTDPVATEQPSEIVHADTPPAELQAAPLPLPPSQPPPPRPATPPRLPRAAAVSRPSPRPAAAPSPQSAAPVMTAAPAPSASAVTAAAAPAAASNAIPTWRGELVARLQQAKRYPASARSNGEQGIATVTFTMDRAGHVLSAALIHGSGSAALDEESTALIHRAEPLPAVPDDMPGSTVTLTVPISFRLR